MKVAAKAKARNVNTKRDMREALKAFSKALLRGNSSEIAKAEKTAQSALDTAVKKDVIHKNKAARKKAQLAAQAKAKGVKASKTTAAKPKATKKPVKKATTKTAAKSKSSK